MKMTLIKYPPTGQCEYEVISEASWNSPNNAERKAAMRPVAGPYYDCEGWMLNAALAGFQGCKVALVEESRGCSAGRRRSGITVYRSANEVLEVEDEA